MSKIKGKIINHINKKYSPLCYDGVKNEKTYRDIMIKNHRNLWKWIMWQTILNQEKIDKPKYFKYYKESAIENNCYLCEYAKQRTFNILICTECPVKMTRCNSRDSLYYKWSSYNNNQWIKASYCAWRISRVNEKKIRKK